MVEGESMGAAMELLVESVDHEARGVAHHEGKAIFVDGALPGERVQAASYRKKARFENAQIIAVLKASSSRVTPRCPHFGVCGGCSMQHADVHAQVAIKQRVLEDNLRHIGRVSPEVMLRPIHGPGWEYRYRARFSVRDVPKKGGVLVGFRERSSSYVADMRECHVVPKRISDLLVPLRELVAGLSVHDQLPQIELAIGTKVVVLVLRHLAPLTAGDEAQVKAFAERHQVQMWLQSKGPETVVPFWPLEAPGLSYELEEFGISMPFTPTDFTQVNHQINAALVGRAVRLLDPQPDERIGDFFCGLGNFTLPIARKAREVVGVEGSASLVKRAGENAAHNGLSTRTGFQVANLFEATPESIAALGRFDKVLVDPPRDGAMELVKALGAQGEAAPRRIVYVSCNPSTLARDAEALVNLYGYALKVAGVVNMFPHTSHVESIAVFERQPGWVPPQAATPDIAETLG
ncbi:MAG TPA: 23S rRNA (uracil(1939)-C(5))-methyltransferase RlmD [Burkholderiales bacterium]|jgi:23S rRNA (uracil1939-C5)-methyltransferase